MFEGPKKIPDCSRYIYCYTRQRQSISDMFEKRQSISSQEKQKYAKLIQGGANFKAIGSLYKKKHGQELARANFHRWKKESVDILASSSKRKFHQQRSKSQVMKDYEAKLVSEYQKRKPKTILESCW